MFLYGKNTVLERIRTNPGSIRLLFLKKGSDLSAIVNLARKSKIQFVSMEISPFKNRFGTINSQGVVAEVSEFAYTPLSSIIKQAKEKSFIPIILDGITDPHNFGAIIRNLSCLGGCSVVIPKNRCCDVNETVLKVASGGENHMAVCRVSNLANSIKKLKDEGFWIVGGVAEGGKNIISVDLPEPFAIVVGSEGKGIRPLIGRMLDVKVSLPMGGADLSYNVSVATTLICYELKREGFLKENKRKNEGRNKSG